MAEEANVDKSISVEAKNSNEMEIDLKYEQNTKAYEEIMKIDLENINTIEKRRKLYTK